MEGAIPGGNATHSAGRVDRRRIEGHGIRSGTRRGSNHGIASGRNALETYKGLRKKATGGTVDAWGGILSSRSERVL